MNDYERQKPEPLKVSVFAYILGSLTLGVTNCVLIPGFCVPEDDLYLKTTKHFSVSLK